jgi:hypothetical protein
MQVEQPTPAQQVIWITCVVLVEFYKYRVRKLETLVPELRQNRIPLGGLVHLIRIRNTVL